MVTNTRIHVQTKGNCDFIDITDKVAQKVEQSGVSNGTVTIFVAGSTAGLTTIEYERGVLSDLENMWERLVPKNIVYRHDSTWGDGNGYSHVRASLLGASLVVPFVNKRLTLGTWQQIILADFDNRPRSRDIVLQIMGEWGGGRRLFYSITPSLRSSAISFLLARITLFSISSVFSP